MQLAEEWLAKGDCRLALRALHLAGIELSGRAQSGVDAPLEERPRLSPRGGTPHARAARTRARLFDQRRAVRTRVVRESPSGSRDGGDPSQRVSRKSGIMRVSNGWLWAVTIVMLGALAWGLEQVALTPLQTGEVYPPFSTLRSDPQGAKALYESLAALPGITVERLYKQRQKLDSSRDAMFVLGVEPVAWSGCRRQRPSRSTRNWSRTAAAW